MRFHRALAASLSLLSGVACGGGDLVLPGNQEPAQILAFGGDDQAGPIGAELDEPLVARVLDADSLPVGGVRVAFQLGDGADGGGLEPDTAVTNGDGLASSTWVLGGTSGRQEVDAQVVGASLAVTFSADAERSSDLVLELESGDEQTAAPNAALASPLVVRLVDGGGDGVAGQAVAWVVATGGGTAAPTSSETDASGLASTSWTLGPEVGTQTLNAVVSGAGVVSFTATAEGDGGSVPSPGLSTVTASPTTIEAGTGLSTITVSVRDENGDLVSGAIVILAATGSGNNLNQPTGPTGSNGVATGTLQSTEPGTKVVSAVVNGAVAITQTATVTVTEAPEPPQPDHLRFLVEPSNVEEDEVISPPLEVAIVDEQGTVVPLSDVEIELELIRSDGRDHNFHGDHTRSTVDGIAVFSDLSIDHDHDDFRFRASVPDRPELGTVETATFAVED